MKQATIEIAAAIPGPSRTAYPTTVAGYLLPPYYGLRFIVIKHPQWETWRVSEYTTGCKVSPASATRKGALAAHEKNLKEHVERLGGLAESVAKINEHVAAAPALNA